MLEIDGEFFENPCEFRKKEKTYAVVEACINTARAMVEALKDKAPELVIQTIKDLGEVQAKMILAQPLWPHFAVGGIVAPVMTGDINAGPELKLKPFKHMHVEAVYKNPIEFPKEGIKITLPHSRILK